MADELSPGDRSSLTAEQGPINMAVAAALIFDRGPGTTYEAVYERLQARLHLIPRYRQKLRQAAMGVMNPVWIDDADFDLGWHLRHATLPAPGGDAELDRYLGREMSRRLDRSRPLWELHVLDGLAGNRMALVAKMHHALVDGVAAVDVGTVILDPTEEPLDITPEDGGWEPRPYDRVRHMRRLASTPFLRGQRLMLEAASRTLELNPRRMADDLRRGTELITELTRNRPQAPMTPLNNTISPNRSFGVARCDLGALKAAGKAAGGTVNDALLAAVTGMLSTYLEGTELVRPPVALVPVSVRRPDEEGDLGNRISTVFVDLPVDEPDPARRIAMLAEQMHALKESSAVRAGAMLVGATGWAPPAVSSVLVRAMGGVRAFNLVVSNVPGPQQPFYLTGSRMREAFPVVPLNPPNQGLTVGILSYDGGVYFGLLADRALDPPVERAVEALDASLAALLRA